MTNSHLLYTVRDSETLTSDASLRGRRIPGDELDAILSALPAHYERHEALALLHALTIDPEVAATAINVLTAYRRDYYLRLYEHALPEGWTLWEPDPPHTSEVRILAPSDSDGDRFDRYEYGSVPTIDVDEMRRLLDEVLQSIPPPPGEHP